MQEPLHFSPSTFYAAAAAAAAANLIFSLFLLRPEHFATFLKPVMFIYLPLDLHINVKDWLLPFSSPSLLPSLPQPPIWSDATRWWRGKGGGWSHTPTSIPHLPPLSFCSLFYLCNMCFGLGPAQASAAIIRLWVSLNFITWLLQRQGEIKLMRWCTVWYDTRCTGVCERSRGGEPLRGNVVGNKGGNRGRRQWRVCFRQVSFASTPKIAQIDFLSL